MARKGHKDKCHECFSCRKVDHKFDSRTKTCMLHNFPLKWSTFQLTSFSLKPNFQKICRLLSTGQLNAVMPFPISTLNVCLRTKIKLSSVIYYFCWFHMILLKLPITFRSPVFLAEKQQLISWSSRLNDLIWLDTKGYIESCHD